MEDPVPDGGARPLAVRIERRVVPDLLDALRDWLAGYRAVGRKFCDLVLLQDVLAVIPRARGLRA